MRNSMENNEIRNFSKIPTSSFTLSSHNNMTNLGIGFEITRVCNLQLLICGCALGDWRLGNARYFAEDQGINSTSEGGIDVTMNLFDCDWELRLYTPVGGVNGTLWFPKDNGQNSSVLVDTAIADENAELTALSSKTVYSWAGCRDPNPENNEIFGQVYLCSDSAGYLFNRSVFSNESLREGMVQHAVDFLVEKIQAQGTTVYVIARWNRAWRLGGILYFGIQYQRGQTIQYGFVT